MPCRSLLYHRHKAPEGEKQGTEREEAGHSKLRCGVETAFLFKAEGEMKKIAQYRPLMRVIPTIEFDEVKESTSFYFNRIVIY